MMLFWIMGGSCSGKKHFIREAAKNPRVFNLPDGVEACWINDGEISIDELILAARQNSLLVRWQWGRENLMRELLETVPDIEHSIIVCKTTASVQVARMVKREGHMKWPERTLVRESEDVQYLAEQLSMDHGLSVRFIDTSKEYHGLANEVAVGNVPEP